MRSTPACGVQHILLHVSAKLLAQALKQARQCSCCCVLRQAYRQVAACAVRCTDSRTITIAYWHRPQAARNTKHTGDLRHRGKGLHAPRQPSVACCQRSDSCVHLVTRMRPTQASPPCCHTPVRLRHEPGRGHKRGARSYSRHIKSSSVQHQQQYATPFGVPVCREEVLGARSSTIQWCQATGPCGEASSLIYCVHALQLCCAPAAAVPAAKHVRSCVPAFGAIWSGQVAPACSGPPSSLPHMLACACSIP